MSFNKSAGYAFHFIFVLFQKQTRAEKIRALDWLQRDAAGLFADSCLPDSARLSESVEFAALRVATLFLDFFRLVCFLICLIELPTSQLQNCMFPDAEFFAIMKTTVL